MRITDWELGALFLNEMKRFEDEKKAVASVKHKFLDELCSSEKETYFFVGTTLPHNSWIVLGVFYPKKPAPPPVQSQTTLDF